MNKDNNLRLVLRIAVVGLLAVLIQVSMISQISLFGVTADITPVVVMAVGLLAGPMLGAVTGFAIGLLVDIVMFQTVGITSLLFITVGYWSGRLRELRDPSHGLIPLALAAVATGFTGLGMAVIQFLLGVDAPVSWLLIQQIVLQVLVNCLIALPVYEIVRRVLYRALPRDPRARRRRAYTTSLSPLQRPSERLGGSARAENAMMLGPSDERTPPMTPQLALRVALVGGLALLLFAVIFFRLWFLQVLTGNQYVAQAQSNVVRHIPVAAPRGEIVDSAGTPLVQSVEVPSIQIAPRSLTAPVVLDANVSPPVPIPAQDNGLLHRLAKLLGISTRPRSCSYIVYWAHSHHTYHVRLPPIACSLAKSVSQSPYANATIKTNVPTYIQDYVAERQTEFPGVLYQDTYIRQYALGSAGAQIFGTLGEVTAKEIADKSYKGVVSGDVVGQTGLEAQYNQYLQGVNGSEGVKVNSQNQFEGVAKLTRPSTGDTLKLSLNAKLEQVGQRALWHSIVLNHGTSGAFIAMDPENGQVYAMGSAPSYNPSQLAGSISNRELAFLNNPGNNYPLLNRAIQSPLPDGSTFKVITATAALESGNWNLSDSYDDTGQYCFKGGLCLHNAGGNSYGSLGLQQAIEVSDDVFFYNLGDRMNGNVTPAGDAVDYPKAWPLQDWANQFGIGRTTGIDLPGELAGEIGSPRLERSLWSQERQCDTATGLYRGRRKHPAVLNSFGNAILSGGCGIASAKYWTIGDNVETGVGQFDDLVTPVQLAVVYGAIANNGTVVTPHVGAEIQSPTGTPLQTLDPTAKRKLNIEPAYLSAIQSGLRLAASGSQGTSADVMGNFPEPVYGKTGTAELGSSKSSPEDAWYACYVPASATSKPIVVVVNVEKGGFGDVAAAPVARQILSQWFLGRPGSFKSGTSSDL